MAGRNPTPSHSTGRLVEGHSGAETRFAGLRSGDLALMLAGTPLWLLAERAIFLPAEKTLFVADTHWGKEATFRAMQIPIPDAGLAADLARLSRALLRTGAQRLVVLGDLLHARHGRSRETLERITAWRDEHPRLVIELIRGNHDRSAGDPPDAWDIAVRNEGQAFGPFELWHHPRDDASISDTRGSSAAQSASASPQRLAGHLHPSVRLQGRGRQSIKLPCFFFRHRETILPAFTSFADGMIIRPRANERFAVVADEDVLLFPAS